MRPLARDNELEQGSRSGGREMAGSGGYLKQMLEDLREEASEGKGTRARRSPGGGSGGQQ